MRGLLLPVLLLLSPVLPPLALAEAEGPWEVSHAFAGEVAARIEIDLEAPATFTIRRTFVARMAEADLGFFEDAVLPPEGGSWSMIRTFSVSSLGFARATGPGLTAEAYAEGPLRSVLGAADYSTHAAPLCSLAEGAPQRMRDLSCAIARAGDRIEGWVQTETTLPAGRSVFTVAQAAAPAFLETRYDLRLGAEPARIAWVFTRATGYLGANDLRDHGAHASARVLGVGATVSHEAEQGFSITDGLFGFAWYVTPRNGFAHGSTR